MSAQAGTNHENLLPLREFCELFKRNRRHCLRRIKAGKMPEATQIAGCWYVYVPARAVDAAKKRTDSQLDTR